MSNPREQFIASDLQQKETKDTVTVSEERSFQFDELTIQNPSIRRGFAYDSDNARNFDQGNVDKAKVGVMQLLQDAMDKAKKQVGELKSNARKQGYDTGFEEGFNKGKEAAKGKGVYYREESSSQSTDGRCRRRQEGEEGKGCKGGR